MKNIRDLEICEVVETKVMEGDDGWTLGVQRDVQRKIIFYNDFTFDFHISFSDFNLLISIIIFFRVNKIPLDFQPVRQGRDRRGR